MFCVIILKLPLFCVAAPPYCSKHRVPGQGWNYPPIQGHVEEMEKEFSVDLGAHPPYHPAPEGFRLSSDSSSDADSSMTSSTTGGSSSTMAAAPDLMDRNRNVTLEGNTNSGGFNSPIKHLSTFNNNNNVNNNDNAKPMLNGILKRPPRPQISSFSPSRARENAETEVAT